MTNKAKEQEQVYWQEPLACVRCGKAPTQTWWPNPEILHHKGFGCEDCGEIITGYAGSLKIQIEVWNEQQEKEG